MILRNFISLRAFTVYMENRSEICTEVIFTTPEVMRTLMMNLPHTEVKFYPEVKSQTGLSSLRVSCKRTHRYRKTQFMFLIYNFHQFYSFNFNVSVDTNGACFFTRDPNNIGLMST